MVTLRIVYTKEKYMRYLSHLELMKLFERIFRFNKLPLRFSEGFNPHPKMTFASPLSVGFSSQYEVMEVQLTHEIDLDKVMALTFSDGIKVVKAKYVESKSSLMANIAFSEYLIKFEFEKKIEDCPFNERVESFMNQEAITYEKKTKKGTIKTINALEQLRAFSVVFEEENELILRATVQSGSNGNLNPDLLGRLLLEFVGTEVPVESTSYERIKMFMDREGKLVELFDL